MRESSQKLLGTRHENHGSKNPEDTGIIRREDSLKVGDVYGRTLRDYKFGTVLASGSSVGCWFY